MRQVITSTITGQDHATSQNWHVTVAAIDLRTDYLGRLRLNLFARNFGDFAFKRLEAVIGCLRPAAAGLARQLQRACCRCMSSGGGSDHPSRLRPHGMSVFGNTG